MKVRPIHAAVFVALVVAALVAACVVNPATGKRQFSLVSESDEIRIGEETDRAIVEQMGLYGGDELQDYVQRIGERMAAVSERPQLDWTFRVIDDPTVNAFALPGGFIYITRGIMAYLDSEAELATVIGHEIGHVTARHSADQMTKAQLTQAGLVLGTALGPDWARGLSDFAQMGAGLLFLKFGRDDERQADELGLRYMLATGYDPRTSPGVFDMLDRVSGSSGGERTPAWLSTHPAPDNRRSDMEAAVARLDRDFSGAKIGRQEYFAHIDGIVYGQDPREGFFDDQRFYHPEMKFSFDFPAGWKTMNGRSSVTAVSGAQDAAIGITLAESASPDRALDSFVGQDGIAGGSYWRNEVNGIPVASRNFTAATQQGTARGIVVFLEQEGRVLRLLGYTTEGSWSGYRDAVERSLASFDRVTDPDVLGVQPARLRIVDAPSDGTLADYARRTDANVDVDKLALLNRMEPGDRVEAGKPYKTVRGGRTP